MKGRITRNDIDMLSQLTDYRIMTVRQLAVLNNRSCQAIRRRRRFLESEGKIVTMVRTGNREKIVLPTEKGHTYLQNKGIISKKLKYTAKNLVESVFVEHELFVNWIRIHLQQIPKYSSSLSMSYLSPVFTEDNLFINISTDNKEYEFIPDGVFTISDIQDNSKKTLLFFLEADRGSEVLESKSRNNNDIRQKILNYQALFRTSQYKRYEKIFKTKLNGFRMLFIAFTPPRRKSLSRIVAEMPPSDFIWVTDQDQMITNGISGEIWARGGRENDTLQSILGPNLCFRSPVMADIR